MEKKITPGEWFSTRYTYDIGIYSEAEGGRDIALVRDGINLEANAQAIEAVPELIDALEAIRARIDGVWDHPALLKFGALSTACNKDIDRIIEDALQKAIG